MAFGCVRVRTAAAGCVRWCSLQCRQELRPCAAVCRICIWGAPSRCLPRERKALGVQPPAPSRSRSEPLPLPAPGFRLPASDFRPGTCPPLLPLPHCRHDDGGLGAAGDGGDRARPIAIAHRPSPHPPAPAPRPRRPTTHDPRPTARGPRPRTHDPRPNARQSAWLIALVFELRCT
jgi:hypothetical protein